MLALSNAINPVYKTTMSLANYLSFVTPQISATRHLHRNYGTVGVFQDADNLENLQCRLKNSK